MTTPLLENQAAEPAAASPSGPSTGVAFRAWARKRIAWIAIIGLLLGFVGYLAISGASGAADKRPLSARNPAPDGAMAAAEVLGRHGVSVTPTESFGDTMDALSDADNATVLLYDPRGLLDASRLKELAASTDHLVVVKPRLRTLNALDRNFRPGGVVPEAIAVLEPRCTQPDAVAAGKVAAQGSVYWGPQVCYSPTANGPGLVAATGDGSVVVLGSTDLMDNEHLASEGNAALTLRTLGRDANLVWYLPGLQDASTTDKVPTLAELAPRWLGFAGPWLGLVFLLAIVWRGRRLGPLVFEPLPVVVKAAETAEGRARLYQDSRSMDLAADNLRAGTLWRLARHFNLGSDATSDSVVAACAQRLGVPAAEVRFVLIDTKPDNEGQLVQWAQQIEQMEQEATAQ